jgi:hypothetical protein
MEYLAMEEAAGGDIPETTWLEPVTGGQYHGPRTNTG